MWVAQYSGHVYGPFGTLVEARERMVLAGKEPDIAAYNELRVCPELPVTDTSIHPGQITVDDYLQNIKDNVDKISDYIDPNITRNSGRTRGSN